MAAVTRAAARAGLIGLFVPVLCIVGSGTGPAGTAVAEGFRSASGHQMSLSGWLHVIWNGEPRFMLVNERGEGTRLVVDEILLRSLGGTAAVNGRRVTIVGERASETPGTVRVFSIELDRETQ